MIPGACMNLFLMVCFTTMQANESKTDPRALLDVIDSLQPMIADFRCEFEGTVHANNEKIKKSKNLDSDGLYITFNGIFIWKSNGDTYINTLRRKEPEGRIVREQIVVQQKKGEAERYVRENDAAIGRGSIEDPSRVNANQSGSLGRIFLIDTIKRLMVTRGIVCNISDEVMDGRALKVMSFSFEESKQLWQRFWIDLGRGGHTVRSEQYNRGGELVSRVNINLGSFKIGNQQVWMPVSGVAEGHAALDENRKPIAPKEPTTIERIYMIGGTLEFNKNPGPGTFKIKYKPGTPISDKLRKMEFEFGQQRVGSTPTRAETEEILKEQIKKAEEQKSVLVVAPTSEAIPWAAWLAWGFGILVVMSSLVLWTQRRGH